MEQYLAEAPWLKSASVGSSNYSISPTSTCGFRTPEETWITSKESAKASLELVGLDLLYRICISSEKF